MALQDTPRRWLMNLSELSISSWSDLAQMFIANFKITYERPLTIKDL